VTKEILASRKMDRWFVYIIVKHTRLYVGITTDLTHRLFQHKSNTLLYFEGPISRKKAVEREKEIKGWTASKKWDLIREFSQQECLSAIAPMERRRKPAPVAVVLA
jgi:putative endonuclease